MPTLLAFHRPICCARRTSVIPLQCVPLPWIRAPGGTVVERRPHAAAIRRYRPDRPAEPCSFMLHQA